MLDGPNRIEFLISKEKLDGDIARLADRLRGNGAQRRAVVGVANGGIYPAGTVADRLGLPYREMHIRSYNGRTKITPEIVRPLDDAGEGDGLLIVDDVVDSGDTALLIRQTLPKAVLMVVYVKAEGLIKLADFGHNLLFAERFPQDFWIVFPWHQQDWAGEIPGSVARYRFRLGLDNSIPITRQ